MNGDRSAVVVEARRTAFGRLDGDLATVDAEGLGATLVRALADRVASAGVPIDDVLLATATGSGGNLARRIVLASGLAPDVPGMTLDRQCGGGLDAVVLACRLVEAGAGELYIAGGVESASTSPLRGQPGRDPRADHGEFFPRARFSAGGWDDPGMAASAEIVAADCGLTRERQDAYAAASHARAVAASRVGAFADEIVPCHVGGRAVAVDGCPRPTLTPERVARFPAIVTADGTVTAANASQLADGAAAVVVASRRVADRLGLDGLRHRDSATAGVDPRRCGLGAIAAAERLRARNPGFDAARIDHLAMVEAFASQTLATVDALGVTPERTNPDGGAIALGHPWGATGAAQVVRLFARRDRDPNGLAAAAIAGGMGTVAWFTAVTG